MELTPRHREVLSLIAQGDEIIIKLAEETVKELRFAGFLERTYKEQQFVYSLTPKGLTTLENTRACDSEVRR